MTVKELKQQLKGLPDDTLVIMSTDEEGNNYSPLDGIDCSSNYTPVGDCYGDVQIAKLTPELEKQGFTNEDVAGEDSVPCIVLYPLL